MHLKTCIAILIAATSCSAKKNNELAIRTALKSRTKIALIEDSQGNFMQCSLDDSVTSTWPLNFPVYRFLKGDVDGDGQDDIAVGIIKPTRNDSVTRKRLFLFQVRNNAIIPLWLGSSLGHPLEDFSVHTQQDSTTSIWAIEKEAVDRYIVAEYQWFGFGLSFRKYLLRNATLKEARTYLDNNK